jgi:hypothetical protein
MKKLFARHERWFWAALLFAVLFPVLAFFFRDVLARFGDLSLFIYDRSFFNETVLKPAGFLEYISAFLAQVLFIPWLGALIAVLLWEAIYWLSLKAFDIPKGWSVLALVPVAALLLTVMGYGDKVNVLLYRNVFYTATLGFLAILAILLICKRIRKYALKMVIIAVAAVAGYLLFGAYGLLGAALAVLSEVSHNRSAVKAIYGFFDVVLLAAIAFLPLAFGRNWFAGVPIVEFYQYDKVNVLPYGILAVFAVQGALMFRGRLRDEEGYRPGSLIGSLAILAVTVLVSCLLWEADADYRAETSMYYALENQDYQKVLKLYDKVVKREDAANARSYAKLMKQVKPLGGDDRRNLFAQYYFETYEKPSRLMTELRMLAIQYMGESGNLLFSAPQGLVSAEDTPFVSQYGPTIYRYWGLFNSSYVWSTATSIHGGWSYYDLREAALAMLLAGNNIVAAKYLDILDNTVCSRWAERHREYLTETAKLREDYAAHYSLDCPREDQFYSENGEIELKILEHFALFGQPDVEVMTPEYSECSVLWAMLSKDMDAFWQALDNYYGVNNIPDTLPRYYQQAAYLYSVLTGSGIADNLPIDDEVRRQYDSFATYMTTHQGSVNELREASYKRFGKTFFYFYFFVDNYI